MDNVINQANTARSRQYNIKIFIVELVLITVACVSIPMALIYLRVININVTPAVSQKKEEKVAIPTLSPTKTTGKSVGYFNAMSKEAITSTTITNEYEGIITLIDNSGGVDKAAGNYHFESKIILKGNGPNPSTIYIEKSFLENAQILNASDSKEKPIKITDLKVGDTITAKIIRSLNFENGKFQQVDGEIKKIK